MDNPYTTVAINNYNLNPPPDDGSTGSNNEIKWSSHKDKIGDPLKTALESVNANILAASAALITAFAGGIVSTAVDYVMTSADRGKTIVATVSGITITTPSAVTVGSGFKFAVFNNSAGNITIDGSGTQTVDGSLTQTVPANKGANLDNNGSNWFSAGRNWTIASEVPYAYSVPVNFSLSASVASNILTIAVKGDDGNDPSATNVVTVPFRNSTVSGGAPTLLSISAALSINTNAVGATLGSSNGVPFRFWIVLFNNGGTPVLGLINCSTATRIYAMDESGVASSTGASAAATSAGVFYTPNGTTISSKAFRIVGYLEYESGLGTAGTYGSVPTRLQLFGPGVRKPGDILQLSYLTDTTQTDASVNNTNVASTTALTIPVSNACNLVRAIAKGPAVSASNLYAVLSILRGSTVIGATGNVRDAGASGFNCSVAFGGLDKPGAAGNATYTVNIKPSGGSSTVSWLPTAGPGSTGDLEVMEIMG